MSLLATETCDVDEFPQIAVRIESNVSILGTLKQASTVQTRRPLLHHGGLSTGGGAARRASRVGESAVFLKPAVTYLICARSPLPFLAITSQETPTARTLDSRHIHHHRISSPSSLAEPPLSVSPRTLLACTSRAPRTRLGTGGTGRERPARPQVASAHPRCPG